MQNKMRETVVFDAKVLVMIVAILLIIAASLFVIFKIVNIQLENCMDALQNSTELLSADLSKNLSGNRRFLETLANVISAYDDFTSEEVIRILRDYQSDNVINRLEILLPDNKLITKSDILNTTLPHFSYESMLNLENNISNMLPCMIHEGHFVSRLVVPIKKNGETVALLSGAIQLENLERLLENSIREDNSYIFLIHRSTGDMIIDTLCEHPDNIFKHHLGKVRAGYSMEHFRNDLLMGAMGHIAFNSAKTNSDLYLYYAPVEETNWFVAISMYEDDIFADAMWIQLLVTSFFFFESICLGVILIMVILKTQKFYKNIKLLSETDLLTGLSNRNRFETDQKTVFQENGGYIACIFMDVNGLHALNNREGHQAGDAMLKRIAGVLREKAPTEHLYRIGGDEFVAILTDSMVDIPLLKDELHTEFNALGYSVSMGIAISENGTQPEQLVRMADQNMYAAKQEHYRDAPHLMRTWRTSD